MVFLLRYLALLCVVAASDSWQAQIDANVTYTTVVNRSETLSPVRHDTRSQIEAPTGTGTRRADARAIAPRTHATLGSALGVVLRILAGAAMAAPAHDVAAVDAMGVQAGVHEHPHPQQQLVMHQTPVRLRRAGHGTRW